MIVRSRERIRQTAEIFTPPPLVKQMLDQLPTEDWTNPTKTFLDNSCGDGNFLVEVVARKVANGSTAKQALSTTFGVELMPDNTREARRRVLRAAYNGVIRQHVLGNSCYETWALERDYKAFIARYQPIVKRNIVCHDALAYHYRFDGTDSKV